MPLKALSAADEAEAAAQQIQFDPHKVAQVLHAVNPPPKALPPEDARITVHGAVTRISVMYEQLRNAVEYREEHLLRKGAIIRILRRQFVLEQDPYVIAHNLIRELIGARYLPNETLPESLIDDAAEVVQKYLAIAAAGYGSDKHLKWVMGVVATELEEILVEPVKEKALVTFLYEQLSNRLLVRGAEMDDTERRLQIYVACYRALIKADEEQVSYKFLRAYLPEWQRPEVWVEHPDAVAERLLTLQQVIHERLRAPITQRFFRAVRPWAVSLWMLTDALEEEEHKGQVLSSREEAHASVASVVQKREKAARQKLRRGTWRAMIYLFITKILFALALEVPIEWFLYEHVDLMPLAVNVGLPPVIMLFVGLMIKRPDSANRMRILESIDYLLTPAGVPSHELRNRRERGPTGQLFFGALYLFMFVLTFGLIGSILWHFEFTIIAILIFYFFLCLVSFFGYRLRETAREIVVVKPKERLLTSLFDFLVLPILHAGQWLSTTVSRVNIFAFILDVMFEAPLKLFLGVMEESLKFIREKKEELSDQ
ncbi:hypothetical protein GF380_06165 [Candidatus Uhrbacteria bacterium]|nr:hypothetical protein [Candidatus Uhrbacteria bacterium]MBD3284559.1 hypothetical protein [Candidatus Uhrbacteria bacterium]